MKKNDNNIIIAVLPIGQMGQIIVGRQDENSDIIEPFMVTINPDFDDNGKPINIKIELIKTFYSTLSKNFKIKKEFIVGMGEPDEELKNLYLQATGKLIVPSKKIQVSNL